MAIQGNAMFTMGGWQQKNREIAASISELPMDRNLQIAKEIINYGKEHMKKLFIFPEKYQELVDKAHDEA